MDKVGEHGQSKKMQKRKAQQKPVWAQLRAQLLFLNVSLGQTTRNCQQTADDRQI